MKTRIRAAIAISVGILVVMGYLTWAVSKSEKVVNVGQLVPNISLPSVNGQTVSLNALRGKPVILDFFTTWCGPCQTEAPLLEQVAKQWQGKVQVVLIDRGESPYMVNEFISRYQLSTPVVLLDKNDRWAGHLGVTGQPETFLIGSSGVIEAHINYEMSLSQLQAMAYSAVQTE